MASVTLESVFVSDSVIAWTTWTVTASSVIVTSSA
jgi:hypothetical protein